MSLVYFCLCLRICKTRSVIMKWLYNSLTNSCALVLANTKCYHRNIIKQSSVHFRKRSVLLNYYCFKSMNCQWITFLDSGQWTICKYREVICSSRTVSSILSTKCFKGNKLYLNEQLHSQNIKFSVTVEQKSPLGSFFEVTHLAISV